LDALFCACENAGKSAAAKTASDKASARGAANDADNDAAGREINGIRKRKAPSLKVTAMAKNAINNTQQTIAFFARSLIGIEAGEKRAIG
jgi:hypothetical protein